MKWQRKLLLVGLLLASSLTPKPALSQTNEIAAQMDLVVKLRIHRTAQATEETAAGFLVGKDQQNAYFITACHAVTQNDKDGNVSRVAAVDLQFHNSPAVFRASVFERYDEDLDLAVVQISVANLPSGLTEVVRKDVVAGIAVHVIGHPSAGDWSITPVNVQGVATPNGNIQHFTTTRDNSLAEGYSGGPVFDSEGLFLGMHTASERTYGIETKSGDIASQLRAWHVPTNNLLEPTTRVQAEVEINQLLDSYEDVYNRKDAKALWGLWPDASSETRRNVKASFDAAQSINMKITNRQLVVAVDGSSATATGEYTRQYTAKHQSPEAARGSITFSLRKQGRTWTIESIK
jgi:ketosteroid isomerase-like protein